MQPLARVNGNWGQQVPQQAPQVPQQVKQVPHPPLVQPTAIPDLRAIKEAV